MDDKFDKKLSVFGLCLPSETFVAVASPGREAFFRLGWLLLFSLLFLSVSLSYAAGVEEKKWSFQFKDCTVSDAFKQITKTSGIKITTNVPIDKKIPKKSFKNKKVAQVLKNLLRGENYVMVWHHEDKEAYSIHISIVDPANQERGEGINPPKQSVSVIHVGKSKNVRKTAGTPSPSKGINKANIKEGKRSSPAPAQTDKRSLIRGDTDLRGGTDSQQSSTPDRKDTASSGEKQTSAPPQPAPEKTSGLEQPPMPPGVK